MANAVKVRELVKTYAGAVTALDGVDLEVRAGSVFGLLGPNGAGKTTLMCILTTQFKPSAGEAHIFGVDVVTERRGQESDRVRPQETSVWGDISGFENLLIYPKYTAFRHTPVKTLSTACSTTSVCAPSQTIS